MPSDPTTTAATESWDDVPIRDCYTKVQGQPCGPRHGWASWLNTFYVCTGTRTPGVAVAALDGDERGVAAPTSPPPPVATAADWQPVLGATTVEEHGGSAREVYVLRECPVCGAAVPRYSTEKHDEWHKTLRSSTGPMGFLSGGRL